MRIRRGPDVARGPDVVHHCSSVCVSVFTWMPVCAKVETISSVYMVSSGIPSRNGERHCIEIARLSIDLMKATINYVIPHMPTHQLQLRIGIHTG